MPEEKKERSLRIEGRKSAYSRDFLYGPFGQALLKKVKTGVVTHGDKGAVLCTCTEPPIPMSIHALGDPPVYKLFSYPGHAHNPACENHHIRRTKETAVPNEEGPALFDQLYGTSRDMKLRIRSFYTRTAPEHPNEPPTELPVLDEDSIRERKKPFLTGKSALYNRSDIILSTLWHNLSMELGHGPNIAQLFYRFYQSVHSIHLVHDEMLDLIVYVPMGANKSNVDEIAFKACFKLVKEAQAKGYPDARIFALARFDGIKPHPEEGLTTVCLSDPVKDLKFSLAVNSSVWEKASTDSLLIGGDDIDYIVGAEVRAERGSLMAHAISVIPVFRGRGFPVSSPYETTFAKHLLRHNLLFDKPSLALPELRSVWNGYVPAFVILHPISGKPVSVAEVFSDDSPEAIISRGQRLEYYKENDALRTLYWDVYRKGMIPTGRIKALAEELNTKAASIAEDGGINE